MVTISYEWQAGKWLFQGLLASVLSGVGFVVLTLAFEYGKRYRRERREREQQVMLEKLLRGDVVLEWNNPQAIVPVNTGCVLRDFSSTNRGSFLINNYKQRGGFLGVGRGYYANRNKPEEDLNSETGYTDKKMVHFSQYNTRIQDNSQPVEGGSKTPEPTPDNDSHPEIKEEARIFQSMINSQSAMPSYSNPTKESVEPGQKDASQPMCKKMCEEMCYRIVKEHPFIAPFIRRDLLQDVQFDAAAEPKASNSSTTGSSATHAPKQRVEICNAFCQSPKKEPTPKAVKSISKIKKRARSMSRCPQSRMRTTPIQLEKRDSLIQKTAVSGMLKKTDLTFSKRVSDIRSEYQKLNNTSTVHPLPTASTTTAPKSKLLKNVRSLRSFSLCRKIPTNNSESFSQNLKFSHAKVTKECTAEVYDHKFMESGEKGSSVDPLTAFATTITENSKARPVCKERRRRSLDRQLAGTPVKKDSEYTSTQSSQCLAEVDNKNSSESRINEIVSALASWGYSIKNKVQGKEIGSATTVQEDSAAGGSRPGFNILSDKDNVDAAKLDSKALIDLIKNLAGSRRHRKLLRQISSVLETNKLPERMSSNSRSFTRTQPSPLAATPGMQTMVKSSRNIADGKAKKTSSNISDAGSRVSQDTKKGPVVKRRRIVRERSYFAKLSSMYTKESDSKNSFYQTPVLPSKKSRRVSSPRLEKEQRKRQRHSTSPQKRQRKTPNSSNLKRLLIKKMEPRVLKKPTSKTLTRRLNNPLRQGIPTERDHSDVVVRARYGKDYAENSSDRPQQSQLETPSNTEINNQCNSDVETTQLVVQTYQMGEATHVEETVSALENVKQFIGHDDSDMSIYQNKKKKRGSQTPDLCSTNDVISCRFSPSAAVNVHARENHNACAEIPNRSPAKNGDAVSHTKDFTLSAVKETRIRASVTINKHRKTEEQTEQRQSIFTRTQSKHVDSNSARKLLHFNTSNFFSEMQTFKPAQRATYAALSKPVAVLKSNPFKLQPLANKSDYRRLKHHAEPSERHSVSVNSTAKKDRMHTFEKSGKKIHNEGIKSIPSKPRENSQVAGKTGRQKSHETRSRFEQYQKNKLIKKAPLRDKTSAGNNKPPSEMTQDINRTTLQNIEREADKNKTSDIAGDLQTVDTSPMLPPALITHTNRSMDSVTPRITGTSLELERKHPDYRQMLDSCISFENDPFEPESDGEEDAWETKEAFNICQQSFNILKKSKLDILVSSMVNSKSSFLHQPLQ
ncbi:hypothetical protein BsWGS_06042 [Bradybaena similaris]